MFIESRCDTEGIGMIKKVMMDKETFLIKKTLLLNRLESYKRENTLSLAETKSIEVVYNILNEDYNYQNRLNRKGLLARTIIDSLVLENEISSALIEFDRRLT